MPQVFTASPNPVEPGKEVTICVSPPPASGTFVWADVAFAGAHFEPGLGLRFTPLQPCVTVMTPVDFITGWVTDLANPPVIQQLVISRTV